jgi:hypothetical protein
MLQRIQSVYLAAVAAISIALFFMPLGALTEVVNPQSTGNSASWLFKVPCTEISGAAGNRVDTGNYVLMVLNSITGILTVMAVFSFKDRKKQLQLCRISLILICLFTAAAYFIEDRLRRESGGTLTYLFGSYLPVIQLILVYMADRAIKKDDDLVKSADRLR